MPRNTRVFSLFVLAPFLLAAALACHAQRSSVSHKTVFVRHVLENQSCVASCQSKEAWITIPHAVGGLLQGGIGARQVHDTPIDGIPLFPRKSMWTGPNEADLAREYDQHVQANIVAYATAMTAWQSQYGLATATHDIVQRVTHRGREKRVIVNVLTFDNGNYYYNGARVMPEDANAPAQILYVRAVPSTVTSGLPSAWNWLSPGTVSYELRGPTFAAGSGFTTTNVGAAYDEPFDYSGTPFDPDAKLVCLVDKSKLGCAQPQPDVKSLLGTTDATYAVLDYYRRVKPSGVKYGSGYVPLMTARVTDRVATFACPTEPNGTYSQVFRYTMKVENRIDRYLVFPDGRYYLIQSFRDVVSPAEAAIPGSSPITRAGEYLNLATRFLHHQTGAFTDASVYTPNTVTLDPVTTTSVAASCGCAPQAPYSELRDCGELHDFWVGTYTRLYTYSAAQCAWSTTQDTSTCVIDWCTNLPGYQSVIPVGTVRLGTRCICTGGRSWNTATSACECPVGSNWNGSSCIAVPSAPTCGLTQDATTTTSGQPFTLAWSSTNAASATLVKSINGAAWSSVPCYPGTLNGSCQPTPTIEGTHLFHFEATGSGGAAACEVTHVVVAAVVDVCDNIPGVQSSPPPGTVQSGTSCICTGGRAWTGSSCDCVAPTIWNGSSCVQPTPTCTLTQDVATTTPGAAFNLTWNSANATGATLTKSVNGGAFGPVPCYPGTLNGTCQPTPTIEGSHLFQFDVSGPGGNASCQVTHSVQALDVCDNIPGAQSTPPPGTVQSGTSCFCTGGRNWNGSACECASPTIWNGSSCVMPAPTCTLTQDVVTTVPSAPFNLTWVSTNAASASLTKSVNGGPWGAVVCYPGTLNGTCQPTPGTEGTHVFKFDVANSGGGNSCQVTHYVQALDVCDNIAGAQSAPPPGTVQSGTSCFCTGGRSWNATTAQCECPLGTSWNGSTCAAIDVCDNISGIQASPPPGTVQSGTSCFCTGGRNWNDAISQCACPVGTSWNGTSCVAIDVCDNIAGVQVSPPFGTIQSGTSCFCTGGRNWNDATQQCECSVGTSWNGASCVPIDVCDNILGVQASPPFGTIQSGTSCFCTGGRSWNDTTQQCECASGTAWNGSFCAPIDVCDNIAGVQTSPPTDTYQSGSSCYCTGGRTWSDATARCECPAGTAWNGATCAITTVPLTFSTSGMIFGETLTVSGPGFSAELTSFWPQTVQVPANQSITITFTPSFNSPFCSGGCVWGIFTTTSNGTCSMNNNQVRFPVSCSFSTDSGGSISVYAPICVDASFSATGTCPLS